ncbi:hypothetical protein ANACOL_04081 [Anaerotruncus colihominis DSM 17241]|uniref:Uncharacterized protein n=1 Tax=Anaerotruncus colihominis DSM 17241 TaxID=445972 RepID=B0PH59_9FIRM|nr:hypothetical protein ANACOL_04081 [Anaerotruncus colihominis DSM 17241]
MFFVLKYIHILYYKEYIIQIISSFSVKSNSTGRKAARIRRIFC